MTTGLVLIVAILVLGGVIATVGDRLGMRVGKARLSLFRLRPRQTATIITILTGSIISASTFAILFAVSDQLRTGVFELGEIQEELRDARRDLQETTGENRQIERELNRSTRQRQVARRQLAEINRSLRNARNRQAETEAQLDRSQAQLSRTQNQLTQIQGNYEQAQTLLRSVSGQAASLRGEIAQLQSERQTLLAQQQAVREQINQRDAEIAERDRAIAARNQEIAEREAALQDLESQRTFLAQEVEALERQVQGLRQGNVALLRNQLLASGILRVVDPDASPQAIARLIAQANQTALQRIRPDSADNNQQVIQIRNADVEQLISQVQDGRDYVVRILSAGNYVVGEPCVLAGEACVNVYGAAALNQLVFVAGQVVATTTVDPTTMTDGRLRERIQLLVAAAQFRGRQAGILSDTIQVADGRIETIVSFFDQIKQYNQPVDLQAVAASTTYTAGPLTIELYASQNNQVLFGTGER